MNDRIRRLEHATASGAYRTYSFLIGAAIAEAAMAKTDAERERALEEVRTLQAEQAQLVRKESGR